MTCKANWLRWFMIIGFMLLMTGAASPVLSAPDNLLPATMPMLLQEETGICQARPLPDLSHTTQPTTSVDPSQTIPASDPQLEALREAVFLLGEGDRLNDDGAVEAARAKWLEATVAYQRAGDQLGEADAYLRLADSYPPFEVALDPNLMNQVVGYYEAALFASASVYETLIQKELTYDQESLAQAETLYEQGRAFYEAGNCQEAQPLLEEARALFQEADFGSGEIRAMITMARCQFNLDDPVSAISVLGTLLDALWIAENLPSGTPTTRRYLEGVDLFEQGRWKEAQAALSEAQEQYQAAGETIAAAHATQDLASAYAASGDVQQAETLYREVLAIYAATPDEYSFYNQAGVHHNLGNIAMLTGRYQEATTHYNTAVELWHAIGEPVREVTSLTGLGWALRETGNYREALATLESAQAQQQRLSPDPEIEGDLLNNIALVYISLAGYDQALDLLHQSLLLRRQLPYRQKELETLNNIAAVETTLGQFGAALETYETILTIANEIDASPIGMAAQANIANVHAQQGKYQQGLAIYLEMLPVYQQKGEQPAVAKIKADIGTTYRLLGDLDSARSHLGAALEMFEVMGDFENAANTRTNLGGIALQAGDMLEAETCLEQTLAIWQTLNNPVSASGALGNLAWVAAAQGDFMTSISRGEEALALVQQSGRQADEARLLLLLGMSHLSLGETDIAKTYGQQVLDIGNSLNDSAVVMAGQMLLGGAFYVEGELPLAYEHTQQAISALEQLQGIITISELKTSFLGQLADAYTLAVLLAVDLGRYEDAFSYAEQARARAFLDQIRNGSVDFRSQAGADLLTREHSILTQIAARRQQLINLKSRLGDEKDTETIADVEDELSQLEADYTDLLVEIKVRSPNVAAWLTAEVDSLADIQASLDVQTTLVEYYVTDEKTLAFVITQDNFDVISLPEVTAENLTTTITDLHKWLNKDNPHPKPLRDLYNWLVSPLIEHLDTPVIGIIPHQTLHYVPFTALTDGEDYLGQQYVLFILPSASSLGFIQENTANLEATTQPALVFGNPTTGDKDFPPLAHAEAEAVAVATLLDVPVYTKTEAQETRFWSDVQKVRAIHLAAHGSYNVDNPLYSAIHLSPNNSGETLIIGKEDGRLEVREIYDLDLQSAEIVALSACQTNIAEVTRADQVISAGDEIIGLTRAFFAAGTPTIISSLWAVDDTATEELMVSFYRHWLTGMGKTEALQMAQRELQATHPGPFYWAGFVLSGDSGHVSEMVETSIPTSISTPTLESTLPVITSTPTQEPPQRENGRGFICNSAMILPLLLIGFWGHRRRKRP